MKLVAIAGSAVARSSAARRHGAAAPRRLHDVPGRQPVEPARRLAAGGRELGGDHRRRSAPAPASTPTSAPGTWDGGPIGIPYNVVPATQKKVRVSFDYADESDRGPYPIPAKVEDRVAAATATR